MITENKVLAALPATMRAEIALKTDSIEPELLELAKASADIVTVVDVDGRAQAHRIAMVLRGKRTDITNTGKQAREDATKFSSAVIAEEKRLIAIIKPEEDRVLALRDAYDAEQARIEAEHVAKERARMEAHELAILAIYRIPVDMATKSAAEVLACHNSCDDTVCGEEWEEYRTRAAAAYAEVVDNLGGMMRAKKAEEEAALAAEALREAERLRVAEEAAALAKQRAEQEAEAARLAEQQAEMQRQREAMAKEAADIEAARVARIAEEEAQRKAVADAQAAEMKRQADEIAEQRAAFEAEQRAAQQAKEDAAKLEADHAEALQINADGHYYSTTTFRDDGKPIMCNPDGTRNIFCDVDEECEPVADTRPVIVVELEVSTEAAPEPAAAPTLKLGMISERLGFQVTAAMLAELGFTPSGKEKAAVLFHESQFPEIGYAFVDKIETAVAKWRAAV